MSTVSRIAFLIWLALAVSPSTALADAFVVSQAMKASTVAEFFVDEVGVRVEIEVGAVDLDAFRNFLPDSAYLKLGHPPRPREERISAFFQHDWVIRSDNSAPLPGRIVQVAAPKRLERDEITGEPLPVQPEDAESRGAEASGGRTVLPMSMARFRIRGPLGTHPPANQPVPGPRHR